MNDTLFGVIALAIFLVVVFAIGILVNRIKNARFALTWGPLIPLINGKVEENGGGAASSWLTGTYGGHKVYAQMIPGRKLSEGSQPFNDFAMGVREVPGHDDWKFEFRGHGSPPWQVTAGSTAIAQRLERVNISEHLPGLGYPKISYRKSTGQLEYQVDITPAKVPTPEQFVRTLDFLIWLADVNKQANHAD